MALTYSSSLPIVWTSRVGAKHVGRHQEGGRMTMFWQMWEDVISSQLEIATDFLTAKKNAMLPCQHPHGSSSHGSDCSPLFFSLSLNDIQVFTVETTRALTYLAPWLRVTHRRGNMEAFPTTYFPISVMWSLSQVLSLPRTSSHYIKRWSLESVAAPWGNSGIESRDGCEEELIQHSGSP